MSEENGKVCCNCRHNIRVKDKKYGIRCQCEIDNKYMDYMWVMEGWCRHWATDEKKWEEKGE